MNGVLTKADLIDKGNEESVLKILRNEVVPLKKGYTLIKCRGHQALQNNESLQKTLEKEKKFFTTHAIFRSLEKNQWGINSLSQKLATDLINFIKKELPNIRSSISKNLTLATQGQQDLICDYPTTPDAKLNFVLNKTYEFVNLFNNLIEGRYWLEVLEIIEKKSTKFCLRLIPHARKSFTDFHKELVKIPPVNSVDDKVNRLLKHGQGREPREFLSYDTFKKIAREFIQNVQPLVTDVMDKIYYNLRSVLVALADHYFGKYPAFRSNFVTIALGHLEECRASCQHDLEMLLVKEKVFFTMDRNYEEKIASLESLKSIKYALRQDWLEYFLNTEEERAQSFQPPATGRNQVYRLPPATGNNSQTMKEILPKYIIVYYLIAIQRISENVSQTIIYFLMDKLYMNLKSKLPSHVARPDVYDLLDSACVGVDDMKSSLKFKIEGLKQGIQEIDKLSKMKH